MSAPLGAIQPAPAFGRADAEAFLRAALERAAAERAIAHVRFPAPIAPLEAPLRALRKGYTMCWRPPVEGSQAASGLLGFGAGAAVAATGAAAVVRLRGETRFSDLEPARASLFSGTLRICHPDAPSAAPRLYGGWSFAEGGADEDPWEGFGDGCFFLPRWSYEADEDGAVLAAAVDLRDGWTGRVALALSELSVLWDGLTRPPIEASPPSVIRVEHLPRARWTEQVEQITDAIRDRAIQKVVAARRAQVRTDRDLDPWAVLRTLSGPYPETWRFGLRLGAGTFLAATPERLFVKRGRVVETDALAGSIAAGGANADALRASLKDQREHRPVVEHLSRRLGPLCEQLDRPGRPIVRHLPNVLHLHTPLRGTLRGEVHASDLAAALHPTPAVGGVPVAEASRWIQEHEPHPRGWYCGPVGWVDADGDAEMTVALRCGVVRGPSAWLWAGGGIVEGSTPDAEWNESALKLRPLSVALGAVSAPDDRPSPRDATRATSQPYLSSHRDP